MKKLLLALSLVLASACSATSHTLDLTAQARCADTVAQAMTSPSAPVDGSAACLDPTYASASGFRTDADLQAFAAKPPIVAIDKSCGARPATHQTAIGGDHYVMTNETAYVYIVHIASNAGAGSGYLTVVFPVGGAHAVDFNVSQATNACP